MKQFIDHHAFLVEHNLFSDEMRDNVSMAGYCIVERVEDVETTIDFNKRQVTYNLLLPSNLCENLRLLDRFKNGENVGFWNSFKLKKFLKNKREIEEINDTGIIGYQLEEIANKFVKAYLNNNWSASVNIFNANNVDENEDFRVRSSGDQPIN